MQTPSLDNAFLRAAATTAFNNLLEPARSDMLAILYLCASEQYSATADAYRCSELWAFAFNPNPLLGGAVLFEALRAINAEETVAQIKRLYGYAAFERNMPASIPQPYLDRCEVLRLLTIMGKAKALQFLEFFPQCRVKIYNETITYAVICLLADPTVRDTVLAILQSAAATSAGPCSTSYAPTPAPVASSSSSAAPSQLAQLPEHADEKAAPDADECAICMENKPCVLLLSCKHLCLCNGCYNKEFAGKAGPVCPKCRAPVKEAMRVYI